MINPEIIQSGSKTIAGGIGGSGEISAQRAQISPENNLLRIDFLFSYWIFAWFLLYYSSPARIWFNPTIALYIGLIENFVNIAIVYKKATLDIFLKYAAMLLFVKVLPIYLLRNTRIHWFRDIAGTVALFAIYLTWLNLNGTDLWSVYSKTIQSISRGDNKTPFFAALEFSRSKIKLVNDASSIKNQD